MISNSSSQIKSEFLFKSANDSRNEQLLLTPDRESMCKELFNEILENLYQTYKNKKTTTQIPKQIPLNSQLTLKHFIEHNKCPIHRTLTFTQQLTGNKFDLTHLKVHQQFVGNLCGYYALFYIQESLRMLKSQDINEYFNLLNPAEFWRFQFKATRFLFDYAKKEGYDLTQLPWTPEEIMYGDLERAFVDPLLDEFPEMRATLRSTPTMDVKVFDYQFQFKRLMNSKSQIKEMQARIDKVRNSREKDKHYVTYFMMGVTNHWVTFCAHKFNDTMEFWYMDSRNRDYLLWTEQDTRNYLAEDEAKKKKEGKKPRTEFQIWVNVNNVQDTQFSLELLVNSFLGNTSLTQYLVECDFKSIVKELKANLAQLGIKYPKSLQEFQPVLARMKNDEYSSLLDQIVNFICVQGYDLQQLISKPEKLKLLSSKCISDLRLLLEIGRAIVMDKRNKDSDETIEWFRDYILKIKF